MDFESRYKKLNEDQKKAVETIDGPVMVIAGPGTGKTELLSMRVANILKKTDTLPENILCLTFTDAGAIAMKKRLVEIIGRDAYAVSVFTFHAFSSDVMNRYKQYFNNGASFALADEMTQRKIITNILDSLDYDSPLRSVMNGNYTAIKDIINGISDLKRGGLSDGEFARLLNAYELTLSVVSPKLSEIFADTVTKQTIEKLRRVLPEITAVDEDTPQAGVPALKDIIVESLSRALEDSTDSVRYPRATPPITAWKSAWMRHAADRNKTLVLKALYDFPKLRALNRVYSLYLQIMSESEMHDYNDMIMNFVHALDQNDDLRYDLQEKYQYIMVDEFQDTNLAQMRIVTSLTDNPVNEGSPNIMVVGDDDQAIYGFQGADVGNIQNFQKLYQSAIDVKLTENYRSGQPILDSALEVIIQSDERLKSIDDKLIAVKNPKPGTASLVSLPTQHDERQYIARQIQSLIEKDTPAKEIAVIGRGRRDLDTVATYLADAKIPLSYDRQDNVLDDEAVRQLENISRVVWAISESKHNDANVILPEVLSHPAWQIDPVDLWEISLQAHKNHEHWLEVMRRHASTANLFTWLVETAGQVQHLPLERMIDVLMGNVETDAKVFRSPLKDYFFSNDSRDKQLSLFTSHLNNLTAIRKALREHAFEAEVPLLGDFLDFIQQSREADTKITSLQHVGDAESSVQLLTAHGSKGLEFDHIFIINAINDSWGKKGGPGSQISFPPHLRLSRIDDNPNERLRLFFVAMTRAKRTLTISYALENDNAKETLEAGFLLGNSATHIEQSNASEERDKKAAEKLWYAPVATINNASMRDFLAPTLANYKLSVTSLNSFLDVTRGGPQHFLVNSLLRFPQARSASSSYGTAVHATLQRIHDHVIRTNTVQPEEDILKYFEEQMATFPFTDDERRAYTQRGINGLGQYIKKHHDSFTQTQLSEFDFANQDVHVGDAHLTGKLDVVDIDKTARTAIVTDYKTGKALASWDKGDDFEKIKAHHYRQQLLFYKLLIENSRDWRQYTMSEGILQFVEPDKSGAIVDLRLGTVNPDELERFTRLVQAVWRSINDLSFPDTSVYEPKLKGILQFEDDLLTGSDK
jgi:DNA helicase-2/ATP-dependent DNA helicase PcrA